MRENSFLFPKDINFSSCEPSGRRGRALLLQTHSVSLTYRQSSLFKLRTHLINFAFGFTQILQYEDPESEFFVPKGFQVSAALSHCSVPPNHPENGSGL